MKLQFHCKVCSKPAEGIDWLRVPKKTIMLREQQHIEAERMRRVLEHH